MVNHFIRDPIHSKIVSIKNLLILSIGVILVGWYSFSIMARHVEFMTLNTIFGVVLENAFIGSTFKGPIK